jgi:hypothetical protein
MRRRRGGRSRRTTYLDPRGVAIREVLREFVRGTGTSCGRSIPTWQGCVVRVLSRRSLRRTRFSPTRRRGGATMLSWPAGKGVGPSKASGRSPPGAGNPFAARRASSGAAVLRGAGRAPVPELHEGGFSEGGTAWRSASRATTRASVSLPGTGRRRKAARNDDGGMMR